MGNILSRTSQAASSEAAKELEAADVLVEGIPLGSRQPEGLADQRRAEPTPIEDHSSDGLAAMKVQEERLRAMLQSKKRPAPMWVFLSQTGFQADAAYRSEVVDMSESSESSSDSDSDSSASSSSSPATKTAQKEKADGERLSKRIRLEELEEMEADSEDEMLRTDHEEAEPPVEPPPISHFPPESGPLSVLGHLNNKLGNVAVIQAAHNGETNILDSGTLVALADRTVIGSVFETFGPLTKPYFSVRFPSDSDSMLLSLQPKQPIYFCPSNPSFATLLRTLDVRALGKGSDASNVFDEEPTGHEMEFSDDEAEQAHKRMLKQSKHDQHPPPLHRDAPQSPPVQARPEKASYTGRPRPSHRAPADRREPRGRGRGARGRGRGRGARQEGQSYRPRQQDSHYHQPQPQAGRWPQHQPPQYPYAPPPVAPASMPMPPTPTGYESSGQYRPLPSYLTGLDSASANRDARWSPNNHSLPY